MAFSSRMMTTLKKRGFTDEQIDYIDKKIYSKFKSDNGYRIMCGRKHKVIRLKKGNEYEYYIMLPCSKKRTYYRRVYFYGCKIPDYDLFYIVINQIHESFMRRHRVLQNRLIIKDYDLIVDEAVERVDAIKKYLSDVDLKG